MLLAFVCTVVAMACTKPPRIVTSASVPAVPQGAMPFDLPPYLTPVRNPAIGTDVIRVTEASAGARVIRHDYARRAAWNADGSRLLLIHPYPARLLDGRNYRELGRISSPSDPLWSHTDPSILFGLQGERELVKMDVRTGERTVLRRFPRHDSVSIGGGEGVQSRDDRFVALLGRRPGGLDLLVVDLAGAGPGPGNGDATLRFDGYTGPDGDIDWAGVSPTGRFVVVKVDRGASDRGFDVYDRGTLAWQRRLLPGSLSHADLCTDAAGDEVLVAGDPASTALVSVRLADGHATRVLEPLNVGYGIHVSCRNVDRPGWAFVSTYPAGDDRGARLGGAIFALRLDGSAMVEVFAAGAYALHPADLAYERQAQAVADPAGARVLFSSDWGDASPHAPVNSFVARRPLPFFAPGRL